MDSRTSVHVIKTACRVLIAVFVRPAALPDSAQSSVSPIPLKRARLQSLASKAEFVYFVEGDIYHGQIDHSKKCGTGSILFGAGGGSYVGEWKDNVFHGQGVRLWANGDRYDGQWVQGKEHGEVLASVGSRISPTEEENE
ncbi:hypothetical protein Pelo_17571 [Pelomyxa schiedti]|nr:hypothetical protein Pelo_17571 [Pelomyxa schiedti]